MSDHHDLDDHYPSYSPLHCEDRGSDVIWVLAVRGLGALVIRADAAGNHGVSTFTKADIGASKAYGPDH